MKLQMLALWDDKVGEFMTPFFAQSIGAGVRSLADLVNGNGGDPPTKHPEDFRLYCVGEWDTSGSIVVPDVPQLVTTCVNLKTEGR